jgi:menaquinone-dependent protoporphyrinogen oxidase
MMERVLIVYGTSQGWTTRIVERIAEVLRGMGIEPTIHRADRLPGSLDLRGFEGALLAGSVQFGRHQRALEKFGTRYGVELSRMPAAFLSVCGALGGAYPGGPAMAAKYRELFAQRSGWRPAMTWSVAGRVAYTRYPYLLRQLMKFISWRTGRPTDTSRDWEFTDWAEVDRLANEFGAAVRGDGGTVGRRGAVGDARGKREGVAAESGE